MFVLEIIINVLILLCNLYILSLVLKVYTEYMKDKSMERRNRHEHNTKESEAGKEQV